MVLILSMTVWAGKSREQKKLVMLTNQKVDRVLSIPRGDSGETWLALWTGNSWIMIWEIRSISWMPSSRLLWQDQRIQLQLLSSLLVLAASLASLCNCSSKQDSMLSQKGACWLQFEAHMDHTMMHTSWMENSLSPPSTMACALLWMEPMFLAPLRVISHSTLGMAFLSSRNRFSVIPLWILPSISSVSMPFSQEARQSSGRTWKSNFSFFLSSSLWTRAITVCFLSWGNRLQISSRLCLFLELKSLAQQPSSTLPTILFNFLWYSSLLLSSLSTRLFLRKVCSRATSWSPLQKFRHSGERILFSITFMMLTPRSSFSFWLSFYFSAMVVCSPMLQVKYTQASRASAGGILLILLDITWVTARQNWSDSRPLMVKKLTILSRSPYQAEDKLSS